MPISDTQRKSEKGIVLPDVNPQFSKSFRELELDLDKHQHISEFYSEIRKIIEVKSFNKA